MNRHPSANHASAPHPGRGHRKTGRKSAALVWLAVVAGLGVAQPALAQFDVTAIYVDDPVTNRRLSDTELREFFNNARCTCGKTVRVTVKIVRDRTDSDRLAVVAGQKCLTTEDQISPGCETLYERRIDEQDRDIEFDTTVTRLMVNDCDDDQRPLSITVYAGQESAMKEVGQTLEYTADGKPPTKPSKAGEPEVGQNMVTVRFTAGSSSETGVYHQLLCAQASDGSPWRTVLEDPRPSFVSQTAACEGNTPSTADARIEADASAADAGSLPDAGVDAGSPGDAGVDAGMDAGDAASDTSPADALSNDSLSGDVASSADGSASSNLLEDPLYVCSRRLSGDGKVSITGLKNGVTYNFYVVSFDESGNVTEQESLGSATPEPTEDLWERYKRSGGQADGSYCSASRPAGFSPGWPALLLLLGTAWRFRRRGMRS